MAKKPKTTIQPEVTDDVALAESDAPRIVEAIERNRLLLIVSTLVLFGVLAFFLVARQMGVERHLKAGSAMTTALAAEDLAGLDKVINKWPGSISAGNALLGKADLLINQGKPQDAIGVLEDVTRNFSTHPRHVQAYFMLANIYHKSESFDKARQNYEKVLELQPDAELSPISRIRIGDIELASGDSKAAKNTYTQSIQKHPGNPFVGLAEQRIALLKVGKPIEIDRPEEAEKPNASTEKAEGE